MKDDFQMEGPSWSQLAALYRWQMALERPALAAAVTLAAPHRDDRVLDLGTGTAGLLTQLTHAAEQPQIAIGVDNAAAMLTHAAQLPERWQLMHADARHLPFADGSFDLITAAYLLHVVAPAQRAQILREARRVLSRRGRLVVVTPAEPRSLLGHVLYAPLQWSACRSAGVLAGLCPLDPREDLERAAFIVRAVRYVERGYRSWCVLASH